MPVFLCELYRPAERMVTNNYRLQIVFSFFNIDQKISIFIKDSGNVKNLPGDSSLRTKLCRVLSVAFCESAGILTDNEHIIIVLPGTFNLLGLHLYFMCSKWDIFESKLPIRKFFPAQECLHSVCPSPFSVPFFLCEL